MRRFNVLARHCSKGPCWEAGRGHNGSLASRQRLVPPGHGCEALEMSEEWCHGWQEGGCQPGAKYVLHEAAGSGGNRVRRGVIWVPLGSPHSLSRTQGKSYPFKEMSRAAPEERPQGSNREPHEPTHYNVCAVQHQPQVQNGPVTNTNYESQLPSALSMYFMLLTWEVFDHWPVNPATSSEFNITT